MKYEYLQIMSGSRTVLPPVFSAVLSLFRALIYATAYIDPEIASIIILFACSTLKTFESFHHIKRLNCVEFFFVYKVEQKF